jgi:hypothetical protein
MKLNALIKSKNGFSITIFSVFFGAIAMGMLLLFFFFTLYLSEIEAFYDDAAIDCFLANRSAIVELKCEYVKTGYIGEFDLEACKANLRDYLAVTFNVENRGDDLLIANRGNKFIRTLEIKEYLLNSKNEIDYTLYITARPYFNSVFFDDPVYKIKSKISIDKFKS